MTVTKASKLQVKTMSGTVAFEVLRITQHSIEIRKAAYTGMDRMATGYDVYPVAKFWQQVRQGIITII